jgi:hypothetical protein
MRREPHQTFLWDYERSIGRHPWYNALQCSILLMANCPKFMTTAHMHNYKVCTCEVSSTRHDPSFTETVPYRSRSWDKEILRGIVLLQHTHWASLLSAWPTDHQPFDWEVFAVLHLVYEEIRAWNDSNGHVRYHPHGLNCCNFGCKFRIMSTVVSMFLQSRSQSIVSLLSMHN